MNRDIEQLVTHEVIPVVRAALRETAELRGAVQVLADRVDRLVGELAEGELVELARLAARALRVYQTTHNGGAHAMNRELLETPFTPAQIKQRKGRNGMLDYVEGHSVIQRLNEALEGAWSFEIVQHEIREDEVLVLAKLSAEGLVKMNFGVSQVTRERESGALVSLGDDLKSALDRELVGTLDLIERDGEGRVVVVDLKTSSGSTRTSRSISRFNCRSTATRRR